MSADRAIPNSSATTSPTRMLAADVMAGVIVSSISLAYVISFSAVVFQGEIASGLSMGLWSLLCGAVVCALLVGWLTSMPPVAAGTDPPTIAMMTVLASAVTSSTQAAGLSQHLSAVHVLLAVSITTLATGALLFTVGAAHWGKSLRFVPSAVVNGFLSATGLLLIASSVKVATGHSATLSSIGVLLTPASLVKLLVAICFVTIVLLVRRSTGSALALPVAFFGFAAAIGALDQSGRFGTELSSWYLANVDRMTPWQPFVAALREDIHWIHLIRAAPEMAATAIVCLIALIVRTSGLEVSLGRASDFDAECRAHGIANIVAGAFGGCASATMAGATKLLSDLGSTTRASGVVISAVLALLLVARINLPSLVPTPVLAGLLMMVGYTLLTDALRSTFKQKGWVDLALAIAIALVCLRNGYIAAVVVGFVASCLIFAISYSRIGVVRRHLTRQAFSGHVERTVEVERQLREQGDAIHLYWLNGYIFFGSSDRVFEQIRSKIEGQTTRPVQYLILELTGVTGADAAALMSFTKLRNVCKARGIVMVYAAASPALRHMLEQSGCIGGAGPHLALEDHNVALAWCEERLIETAGVTRLDLEAFERWLADAVNAGADGSIFLSYFERRAMAKDSVLYRQGTPADTIDIVATGTIGISVEGTERSHGVRRMARRTVVGEMGFFRGQARAATVLADEQVQVYTLTRAAYDRMLTEQPRLATGFLIFIIRTLSDRLEFANTEIAALIR